MKRFLNPSQEEISKLITRGTLNFSDVEDSVKTILNDVAQRGDGALTELSKKYDQVDLKSLCTEKSEIQQSLQSISEDLKEAIRVAISNIEKFHISQFEPIKKVETSKGVTCWRKSLPIEKVGLYIPGGTAPLFSTLIMLAVPAKLAGAKEIIVCTPPNKDGQISPAILYVANLLEISKIYKVGGAQAIAAMAYGTQTIPKVDKIFGPGNQYVTVAKQMISSKTAIDMPAGPSEVLVIADDSCNPIFVAADLLSQAEHGADSQVILITDSEYVADAVEKELEVQLAALPRKVAAQKALENSSTVVVSSINKAMEISNLYAPEHLILAIKDAEIWGNKVSNAGSVFLGNYSCESAGDYASGTNHTLPTNGYARSFSGVSLDSFMKKVTFQNLSEEGIRSLGKHVELMAETEGLEAHANAMRLRLKAISND